VYADFVHGISHELRAEKISLSGPLNVEVDSEQTEDIV